MLDLIVKNGTIIDGTERARFSADVAVRDGRIVEIAALARAAAATELDATGLVVTPGFIDIHSHSDFTLLVDPRAHSAIAQGVTTELVGNCGHGCAPIVDIEAAKGNVYGYVRQTPVTWSSTSGYLEQMDAARPGVNLITLVPNGLLRIAVMGRTERPATVEERRSIARLLEEALDVGAAGFSVGLEYAVEQACTQEEMAELCALVARYDGIFAPHTRNRARLALEAIDEVLDVSAASDVRLHIPHIIPRRGGAPDADVRSLERVDRALARGRDVSFDMHTRLHGFTYLAAALPAWASEGGPEALRERLSDPATRGAIARHESLITSFGLGGWHRVFLVTGRRPELVGKSFQEIAESKGTSPFDAVLDVLFDEADDPYAPLVMCESYREEQLLAAYQHPAGMAASDATTLCIDGPLAASVFHGAFTWASWFFRRLVREERALTLEQAVRKLAGQPAQRVRLADRGILRAGAWADMIAFDPVAFGERGTLDRPNQLAQGMVHVVVNGIVEMSHGAFTGLRGGRVLRHRHG
jgi:N-acyl-D-amino-acid deacylase